MQFELTAGTVRSWRWEDRESLVQHANNRNVWINLRDRFPHPYTISDAQRWLDSIVGLKPEMSFAIAVSDQAVGGIGFEIQHDVEFRSAEIGYWLGEEFWGRKLATEALVVISNYVFENFDVCRLYAHVFEWNPRSKRVLEKAGYEYEGRMRKSITKEGQTIDQLMYAMVRE